MNALAAQIRQRVKEFGMPIIYPRRFHAYCVGAMKSGTHSIAGIFAANYRSRHEPDTEAMLLRLMAEGDGRLSRAGMDRFLHRRDRRMWLEMDSSVFNCFALEHFMRQFPNSRFILTVRDCYSWLDSCLNHLMGRHLADYMTRFLDWWLKPETFRYAAAERILEENRLPPVEKYLQIWADHNQRVIDLVPPERLLVVRTHEIQRDVPRMAEFLGVPAQTLDPGKSHLFRAAQKYNIISQIPKDFIEERVAALCGPLMDRLFPEIRGLDGALSR